MALPDAVSQRRVAARSPASRLGRRAVIGFFDAVRSGMALLPLPIGPISVRRLTMLEGKGNQAVREVVEAPFAHSMVLAVHPARQGRRLATAVVAEVEQQVRAAGFTALVLPTEQPINVAMYEHLGFLQQVTDTGAGSGLSTTVLVESL